MNDDLGRLCARLDTRFSDPRLLEQAVTHRSAGADNNERLEYLGDAVLGMVIAESLYVKFPEASEGDLSRLRANLVKKPALAEIARELELGRFLRLGSGELKSGGFRRDSILADALEAIIGAVYLDAGFAAARRLVTAIYAEKLAAIDTGDALKDPKTRLQEYLQARQVPLPDYAVTGVTGESHQQIFEVQCRVELQGMVTTGQGGSRRKAEQEAARLMLIELDGGSV